MLVRIVRMTFQANKTADFLAIFNATKDKIRNFAGCQHLELLQDNENPAIFMTYSHWASADALENYRNSALFQATWASTKALFADKPVAFSSKVVGN
jgi:quinol monooxygenase YgiN